MLRLLDLFCGRFGWSKAFAARGWECFGVDLVDPPDMPKGFHTFLNADILDFHSVNEFCDYIARPRGFDFIVASSPCEQFSVHGMKHFHPNPPYPELGIKLFNHTRQLCEAAGVPYVMENVRAAQQFVGNAVHHCGPFYLWGNAVPPILNQGIGKDMSQQRDKNGRRRGRLEHVSKAERASQGATIPPELANCVADYAERLLEQKRESQACKHLA